MPTPHEIAKQQYEYLLNEEMAPGSPWYEHLHDLWVQGRAHVPEGHPDFESFADFQDYVTQEAKARATRLTGYDPDAGPAVDPATLVDPDTTYAVVIDTDNEGDYTVYLAPADVVPTKTQWQIDNNDDDELEEFMEAYDAALDDSRTIHFPHLHELVVACVKASVTPVRTFHRFSY